MLRATTLADIVDILADPVSHEPLQAVRDEAGALTGFRSARAAFSFQNGIADLRPDEETLIREYGARDFAAWRKLQTEAEDSYAVRVEGHFSTENYAPARAYGEILATLDAGLFLDVGCGLLPLPVYMQAAKRHAYVGVDPMDVFAEREFPFVQAYGDFLPFQSGVFDGVMFSSSFDHTINPWRALEEALRILKPDGYCVIFETVRDCDVQYQGWLEKNRYGIAQYNKHHNWAFTEDDVTVLARLFGLDVVRIDHIEGSNECVYVLRKTSAEKQARRLYGSGAKGEALSALARDWAALNAPSEFSGANAYLRKMNEKPFAFYRKRALQLNFTGERLYDAGGGVGTWSFAFAPDFESVLCIDMSEERIETAKHVQKQFDIDNIEFRTGDMLESGLPDGAVDAVFCYGVVVSYLEFDDVFAEFHRILKPGGRLYACVNGPGWWRRLIDQSGGNEKRKTVGMRAVYNSVCRRSGPAIVSALSELSRVAADADARAQRAGELGVPSSVLKDFYRLFRKIRNADDPNAGELFQHLRDNAAAGADGGVAVGIIRFCDRAGEMEGRLIEAFEEIAEVCGEAYAWAFLRDLSLIFCGKADKFSHASAGRSYAPDEVRRSLAGLGFGGFVWDIDGGLDLRPPGRPGFAKEGPIYSGWRGSDLAVWEFVAAKRQ